MTSSPYQLGIMSTDALNIAEIIAWNYSWKAWRFEWANKIFIFSWRSISTIYDSIKRMAWFYGTVLFLILSNYRTIRYRLHMLTNRSRIFLHIFWKIFPGIATYWNTPVSEFLRFSSKEIVRVLYGWKWAIQI